MILAAITTYQRRDDRRCDERRGDNRGPDHRFDRLSPPPRGYQWIQNGSDYLLIGITTGVIATMILGNSF